MGVAMVQGWCGVRWNHKSGYLEAGLHPSEAKRLETLHAINILQTGKEQMYDEICEMAANIFQVEFSFISLVDEHSVRVKASYGMDVSQTERAPSVCAMCVAQEWDGIEIPNCTENKLFSHNPHVTGTLQIHYYASFLLRECDTGLPLGTLCVMSQKDKKAKSWQMKALRTLSRQVCVNFPLRKDLAQKEKLVEILQHNYTTLRNSFEMLDQVTELNSQCFSFAEEADHPSPPPVDTNSNNNKLHF